MSLLLVVFFVVPAIVSVHAAGTTCGPNEYKSQMGECCRLCGKGHFVLNDCTSPGTRCFPCAPDTYVDKPNGSKMCLGCKTCDSSQGLRTLQKCSIFSNTVCAVRPGYYCSNYTDENKECRFAVKHSACSPGQGIKTPGNDSADTLCEDCSERYFSLNGINCTEHTNCAARGEEVEVKGTPVKDNQCRKPSRSRYGLIPSLGSFALVVIDLLVNCCQNIFKQPYQPHYKWLMILPAARPKIEISVSSAPMMSDEVLA